MVQLVEIEDEHFEEKQPGPSPAPGEDDDAYYTDTDSSITEDDEEDEEGSPLDETLYERIVALKDMIPPSRRAQIQNSFDWTYGWVSAGLSFGGKSMWILSTSALMLGVPYVLAYTEEQQMLEMEKEMQMQQNVNEMITPGSKSSFLQEAQQQQQANRR